MRDARAALLLLAANFTVATSVAAGEGRSVTPGSDLARVVTPAPGEALVAGETAWLAWEPGPGLARLPLAEEWEAFLSLDGGRTFAVRLTPHLDLGRSRVAFRVPPLASDDVRLLLRFGDERQEWEQPVPGRYRIVPGVGALPSPRRRALAPGEAARPGDSGVLLWAEGGRDGSGRREVEATGAELALGARLAPSLPLLLLAAGPERPRSAAPARDRQGSRMAPPPVEGGAASPAPASPLSLLLLIHRLNE